MNIRDMEIFLAVANNKNFSKAAEELYISQPVVSKIVKNLENDLGILLIDRTTRSFSLTDAGKAFYIEASAIVNRFCDLPRLMKDYRNSETGHVNLGIPPQFLMTFCMPLLQRMRTKYPNIDISLLEGSSKRVLDMIASRTADIGITQPYDAPPDDVEVHTILQDRCALLVHKDHYLANSSLISLKDLSGEKFIALTPGFSLYNVVMDAFKQAGISPHVVFECSIISFCAQLVANHEGVSILPRPILEIDHPENTVIVNLKEYIPWGFSLSISKSVYRTNAVKCLFNLAMQYFEELVETL